MRDPPLMDYVLVFALGVLIGYLLFKERKSPKPAASSSTGNVGDRTFSVHVVGESHYQDALESICGGQSIMGADKIVQADLLLEDDNPYDPNAVRVDIQGKTVGHLSREMAKNYRAWLEESGRGRVVLSCRATIVGGWDRGDGDVGHFGVRLDLPAE